MKTTPLFILLLTFFYHNFSFGHTADVSNTEIKISETNQISVLIEKVYFSILLDKSKKELTDQDLEIQTDQNETNKLVAKNLKNQIYLISENQPRTIADIVEFISRDGDFDALLTFNLKTDFSFFKFHANEDLGTLIVSISWPDKSPKKHLLTPNNRSLSLSYNSPEISDGFYATAKRYMILGFIHIIPEGVDHILFILALFFLVPSLKQLLFQVTAFTVAHSITLIMVTMEVLKSNPDVVEPLIAFSIACVALENILLKEVKWWRIVIIIFFGLLHGMGFAGVLSELGLPPKQTINALVSFNIGVEIGQIAVLIVAYLLLFVWIRKNYFRKRIAIPCSLLIGLIGLYWTIERIFWS